MGEENISRAIEQKVAAGLMDVFLAVILPLHSFTEKFQIAQYGRRRKNLRPREAFQAECSIGYPLGVCKNSEWPLMLFLVMNQLGRVGKRNHDDRNVAPVEFYFKRFHLAEVSLASQSSEMPEKDQEYALLKVIPE
jgi:hypothetical protein